MPYIKPNEEPNVRYHVTVMPAKTQKGYPAVRFIGEKVPDTYEGGFKYYDDNDDLILDLTLYNDYYSPNVYSTKVDEPVMPKPNNTPTGYTTPGGGSTLAGVVNQLKAQVASMETYTETKKVYIEDTEVVFDMPKDGAVSAQLKVNDTILPCEFIVDNGKIVVTFEELEELGEVTIFIVPVTE